MRALFFFVLFFLARPCLAVNNGVIQSAVRGAAGTISSVVATQVGQSLVLTRNYPVSAASANAALVRRMLNPAGAAIVAAALLAEYLLEDGKLMHPGSANPDGIGACFTAAGTRQNLTLDSCKAWYAIDNAPWKIVTVRKAGDLLYKADNDGGSTNFNLWQKGSAPTDDPIGSVVQPPTELSEAEKTDFRESLSDDVITPQQILSQETGIADRQVPETAVQIDDMHDDYHKATDTNPDGTPDNSTQPDTDPTIGDDGIDSIHPGETPVMPSKADQLNKDSKTDCDKYPNSIGCSLYGDPATPDSIQQIDLPIQLDVGGTWGNTSCPSPIPLPLFFGSTQFSLQPMCDFMLGVRPVVFALSWLLAGFIVMSSVRD
jgi:hypothetical protein